MPGHEKIEVIAFINPCFILVIITIKSRNISK